MVKTVLMILAGTAIAGVLGLFVFFAVSPKSANCCGGNATSDNADGEIPPCCATLITD